MNNTEGRSHKRIFLFHWTERKKEEQNDSQNVNQFRTEPCIPNSNERLEAE